VFNCFFLMIRTTFFDGDGFDYIMYNYQNGEIFNVLLLFIYMFFISFVLINGILGIFAGSFSNIIVEQLSGSDKSNSPLYKLVNTTPNFPSVNINNKFTDELNDNNNVFELDEDTLFYNPNNNPNNNLNQLNNIFLKNNRLNTDDVNNVDGENTINSINTNNPINPINTIPEINNNNNNINNNNTHIQSETVLKFDKEITDYLSKLQKDISKDISVLDWKLDSIISKLENK
jgi:hypothetical protein